MFRIILLFILIAIVVATVIIALDLVLGHRLLIPLAKAVKFKTDDVKKTDKIVSRIFDEEVEKDEKKPKRKSTRKK